MPETVPLTVTSSAANVVCDAFVVTHISMFSRATSHPPESKTMRRHFATSRRLSFAFTAIVFAAIAPTARPLRAQESPPVRGVVRDSAGTPIPDVDVAIVAQHL